MAATVLDVVTDLSAATGGDSAPEAAMVKPIMAKFFGTDDKLHNYIAALDDQTLVSTYGGEDQLREAIAAMRAGGKSTSAAGPQSSDVAALLPGRRRWWSW